MYSIEGAVVFQGGGGKHWIMRCLKIGFKHCYVCVKYDEYYIVIDGLNSHSEIIIIEDLDEITQETDKIIYFCNENSENMYRGGLCWFNCVEVVKSHMGIKSFWTFTPYQLYKLMVKHYG